MKSCAQRGSNFSHTRGCSLSSSFQILAGPNPPLLLPPWLPGATLKGWGSEVGRYGRNRWARRKRQRPGRREGSAPWETGRRPGEVEWARGFFLRDTTLKYSNSSIPATPAAPAPEDPVAGGTLQHELDVDQALCGLGPGHTSG